MLFSFSKGSFRTSEWFVNFLWSAQLQRQLPFRVCQIKMSNSLRNRQETVHVISARKHFQRDIPGGCAIYRHEFDYLCLALLNCPNVAIEQFIIVMHRLAVATVYKRWRERTKPRQTDQIFRKRRKTFRRVHWIRGQNRIRRDSLQYAIARNNSPIS